MKKANNARGDFRTRTLDGGEVILEKQSFEKEKEVTGVAVSSVGSRKKK